MLSFKRNANCDGLYISPVSAAALSTEVDKLAAAVDASTAAHKEAAAALETKRARLHECDSEIKSLEKERQKILKEVQETEIEKKRRENRYVVVDEPIALTFHYLDLVTIASVGWSRW